MSAPDEEIDWNPTSWEGNRLAQFERALTLTLRERLEAAEALAEIARHFEGMRNQGNFKIAGTSPEGDHVDDPGQPAVPS